MSHKTKNILIISLIILLLGSIATILTLLNKDSKETKIIGEVLISDSEYLIIKSNDNDYLINNIKGKYNIGDKISITFKGKDLNTNVSPYTVKIIDEELLEVSNTNISEDNIINNSNNNEQLENNTTNNNSYKPSVDKENTDNVNTDDTVLNYIDILEQDFKSGTVSDTLKSGFVTVIDFIFYNGTIKDHTFNELTSSAKLKVLSLALYFDNKIESYFPGYKESISNTTTKIYTNIKSKIVESYLTLTANICNSNEELCLEAKKNFSVLKTNFNLTWSLIKDIAGDGLTNLKSWYEIWRE